MHQRIKLIAGVALAVGSIGIAGTLVITRVAISQEPDTRYRPQAPFVPSNPNVAYQNNPSGFNGFYPGTPAQIHLEESEQSRAESEKMREESSRLEKLLKELRSTDTSEGKEQTRQELAEMLSAQLDRDLEQREAGLAAIEERAKDLRKQLELRRSNKDKTIEMLLMIAENPTAGLGIPEQWLRALAPSHNLENERSSVTLRYAPGTYDASGPRYYPTTGNVPSQPMDQFQNPPMFPPGNTH